VLKIIKIGRFRIPLQACFAWAFLQRDALLSNKIQTLMKLSTTHYLFILDKSGSMATCWDETISALRTQFLQIEKYSKENVEHQVKASLIYFDNQPKHGFTDIDGKKLALSLSLTERPNGGTALMDAIGIGIHQLQQRMKPQDDAIVIMLTDGEENASQLYTFQQIAEIMDKLRATEKWTFTLLGAEVDAFESIGSKLNMQRNHVYMYEKSKTSQVFDEINYKTQSFFEKKSKGESLKDVFNFDDSI
jgi:hypothetical protein